MVANNAAFPIGTRVRIADRAELQEFMRTWKYHHKLRPEQLAFAADVREVKDVGYYHGGDILYVLDGLPDYLWHGSCLRPAE